MHCHLTVVVAARGSGAENCETITIEAAKDIEAVLFNRAVRIRLGDICNTM